MSLREALAAAARAPVLLVAADYDGTLAPIVDDPAAAVPHRPALDALVELAAMAGVEAMIVSGRSRQALRELTGEPPGVLLVGTHGAEWPGDPSGGAGAAELIADLADVAGRYEGTLLEPKPQGGALHYRHAAAPQEAAAAAREVGARHGARVIDGKMVVELLLGDADKGQAVARARDELGAGAIAFFGDDTTDEDVFAMLGVDDVGVKVGDGDTRAQFRVADPAGVAEALRWLAGARGVSRVERVITGDGVALAARRWDGARAPGFVLAHGLASNLETWAEVAGRLAAAGHPVVAYDQRGHGRSDRPAGGYDLATSLADLDAVIGWSGLARPVLAGQSWGGNLVLAHAARRSGAAAVVCVDGGTIDLAAQFPSWEACAQALRPPVLDVGLAEVEAGLRASHPDWSDRGVAATLANLEAVGGLARNRLPLGAHLALVRAMWDHPPGDLFPDVGVPVRFLLAATGDAAWTAAKRLTAGQAVEALPDASVEWVEGDHDLHVQQPALVADRLLSVAANLRR